MAEFQVDPSKYAALKDKVVVITGGATGIGAATVKLLAKSGANIVIGDINTQAASDLVSSLNSDSNNGAVSFKPCDVTKYSDIYSLFQAAYKEYGRIDHAVSCAGVFERGDWFSPELTIETVGQDEGDSSVMDINWLGSARFARVAVVFLREGMKETEDKSLTFMSSVNSFRESPGLYMYQTSKHAIQGLMRSSRKYLYERDHIRVNCVCPGVTDTPMTVGIVERFKEAGLFTQPPEDVAKFVLGFQVSSGINGKGVYVEGGDGWEFEDSFYEEQPRWLGEEATRRLRTNAEAVNKGALTKK